MTKTIATHVHHITRAATSTMGNPSYVLHTSHGNYRTQSNSGWAYSLDSGPCDKRMELVLTSSGTVRYGRELTGELVEPKQ